MAEPVEVAAADEVVVAAEAVEVMVGVAKIRDPTAPSARNQRVIEGRFS